MKNMQFAIIGLGRFGLSLVKELHRMGLDILAVDLDKNKVNLARDYATYAVEADSTDEQVLKTLGIRNFDVVVVAIGENVQSNILTVILLKDMGVPMVVAKAQNHLHGRVLEKIGTDLVIYPERDMAIRVAHSLVTKSVLDHINLSSEYSILEIITPNLFVGKTIRENNIRKKHQVSVIAIKRGEEIIVNPTPEETILAKDILVVLGKNNYLDKLSDM
ncbi:MAG: TrkA family potassium uptake protein [Syntrophomonadaceae bacterium]|jgi:trk system potassium uptake protein TrkA|nr:TrkA family potassium uptake protein [Syntrophomonadaceae bacterium]